jgi:hypothetical protein
MQVIADKGAALESGVSKAANGNEWFSKTNTQIISRSLPIVKRSNELTPRKRLLFAAAVKLCKEHACTIDADHEIRTYADKLVVITHYQVLNRVTVAYHQGLLVFVCSDRDCSHYEDGSWMNHITFMANQRGRRQ